MFNSSAHFKGHALNEYWAKAPNVFLNTLFCILIRFRENHVGFIGDVSKMYNSVRIKLLDQHCHRFLWRNMKLETPLDTYVMTRVNMGDRPSGTIASLALRKTAEMKRERHPMECATILKSSYMDDIIDCTDTIENAIKITSNFSNILKSGDFNIKQWVISPTYSDTDIEAIDLADGAEKVLGMSWVLQGDYFRLDVRLNFSRKRGKLRSQSNVSVENFDEKIPSVITKRMLLSQLNSIYDPLGLLSPFIIKGKVLLKQLCVSNGFGWDKPIPEQMHLKWVTFLKKC